MTRIRPLALVLVLAITGCQDPYARGSRPHGPDGPSPTAVPPPTASPHAPNSAGTAVRLFGTRWINWDWQTAARQQRALARLAFGSLAAQLRANAASARIDATLARDKPGSRGTVAAVDLHGNGARAAGIVVTHEQTTTDGRDALGGSRYRVYLVHLEHDPQGWVVSAWAPQP